MITVVDRKEQTNTHTTPCVSTCQQIDFDNTPITLKLQVNTRRRTIQKDHTNERI